MQKGVSIIISTYNGADNLPEAIEHVSKQQIADGIPLELIVVDNNSSDNSAAVAQATWGQVGSTRTSFRLLTEKTPGKYHALQLAIKEARYEYVIICDDDNWLAPDYAQRVYDILDAYPEVGAVGGLGTPETKGLPLPEWFEHYLFAYAVGPQSSQTGFMRPRAVLWGAGMATKRSVYMKMYQKYPSFLPEFGVATAMSSEDTEYCMRLILKHYKLYYDEHLKFKHFIPERKLNEAFRDKLLAGFKSSNPLLRKYFAAMRAKVKTRNRPDIWLMLLLITPINYLFSFSERRADKAKLTLYHLLPGNLIKVDPISKKLKAFISEKI
jgi:glycosyltransferase involved in cell wall biosynthesis